MRGKKSKQIWIDTDPGVDDALAIIFALGDQKCKLKGISTVAGNVGVEQASRNLKFLWNHIGQNSEELQGHCFTGASKPISRNLEIAVVHGDSGFGEHLVDGEEALTKLPLDWVSCTAKDNLLCALGPLTNFANQDLSNRELFILGGVTDGPGNKGAFSEFNFYVDPESADKVMLSGANITLIPLEICFKACFELKDFERTNLNSEFHAFIQKLLRPYVQGNLEEESIEGVIMYDPLVIYAALYPEGIEVERVQLRVETKGELTRGMSVIEKRANKITQTNVSLVRSVNIPDFKEKFFEAFENVGRIWKQL